MHDPRYDKLAKVLVEYSTRLKRNETVLIETFDVPDEMTSPRASGAKGGRDSFRPDFRALLNRELALNATERQLARRDP
jgi:aminopeptidase